MSKTIRVPGRCPACGRPWLVLGEEDRPVRFGVPPWTFEPVGGGS